MSRLHTIYVAMAALLYVSAAGAQGAPQQGQTTQPAPPPATKIEGFKPAAGSVFTLGYDDLGSVSGVSVDVREMRDQKNTPVRGLLVEITEGQYRKERSFVDADEIPGGHLVALSNPSALADMLVAYAAQL